MLIEEYIDLPIGWFSWKHYRDLGYDIKTKINSHGTEVPIRNQIIKVKINDITPGNNIKIKVKCDYCGKEFEMFYYNYYNLVLKGAINKVACRGKCSQQKLEESNLKQYGVRTSYERKEVKQKALETMIERYGVEYAAQNQEINQRIIEQKLMPIEEVYKRFTDKGLKPLFKESDYKGVFHELSYMCPKHDNEIRYTTLELLSKSPTGCPECGREMRLGENHYMWKGGISPFHFYIRSYLYEWKNNSLEYYGDKCLLTKQPHHAIHHLYGFNLILEETLNNLNLDIRPEINMYTQEELDSIKNECLGLHNKYGYGVPLSEEIHNLFHNLYGRGNNTPEQFEEFKIRYRVGEFNEILTA